MRIQVFKAGILIADSDLVGLLRDVIEEGTEALILLVILCLWLNV